MTTSVYPYVIAGSEVVEEAGEKRKALADLVEPKAVSGEDIIHEPFVPKGMVASTEVKSPIVELLPIELGLIRYDLALLYPLLEYS